MKKKVFLYIFVVAMAVTFIGPMLFTIASSLKDNKEIFSAPFSLPKTFRFENYKIAWEDAKMSRYMLNSIFIAVSSVITVVIVSSMGSFVLSRFNFKINKYVSLFILMGMMVPMHTILVPVSYIIAAFDLKNNLIALVLLYVAFSIPFSTIVLTRFMQGISKSVEEAAVMDGASFFKIYWKIILPMSIPALSTVAIFNFLGAWNDVLFPLLFINDDKLKTVSLGLLNFQGERGSEYGPMMAAIGITLLIPLVIYLFFQEKVEEGIAAGGVKE